MLASRGEVGRTKQRNAKQRNARDTTFQWSTSVLL
jgi:hypothetical protein